MKRSLLVFDLMDTVIVDPFFTVIPSLLGRPVQQVMKLFDTASWIAFECGVIDETTYFQRMYQRHQPDASAPDPSLPSGETIRQALHAGYCFTPGMETLLQELVERNRTLWVLSNYPCWATVLRHKLALDRYFRGFMISYQTGVRKPDARAYQALCTQAGVEASSCLLVDDRQENVEGARRVGMPALLFQGVSLLRQELLARKVL